MQGVLIITIIVSAWLTGVTRESGEIRKIPADRYGCHQYEPDGVRPITEVCTQDRAKSVTAHARTRLTTLMY